MNSLNYATTYNIESWDGYIVTLALSLGARVVYSMDKELSKVKEITVINPFPKDAIDKYHKYIKAKLRKT